MHASCTPFGYIRAYENYLVEAIIFSRDGNQLLTSLISGLENWR